MTKQTTIIVTGSLRVKLNLVSQLFGPVCLDVQVDLSAGYTGQPCPGYLGSFYYYYVL